MNLFDDDGEVLSFASFFTEHKVILLVPQTAAKYWTLKTILIDLHDKVHQWLEDNLEQSREK